MDALTEFLEDLKRQGLARGHFLGLLHLLIARPISTLDGTVVSEGLTWRALAGMLKKVRWNKDSVLELGLDPDDLPPRDRLQYWYTAISRAGIDSGEASAEADTLAATLRARGYEVGAAPRQE